VAEDVQLLVFLRSRDGAAVVQEEVRHVADGG